MDAHHAIEWLKRQVEDACQRSAHAFDAAEREHWNKIADEYLASKHALERAITSSRKGVVRR